MTDFDRIVPEIKRPKPTHALPSCYGLLSENVRNALWTYRIFGYVGFVMSETAAYIELLEAELARHEAKEIPNK